MLSIRAWKTFFSLSLFLLPVLGVLDVEASRQWLDSVCMPKHNTTSNESQKLTNDSQTRYRKAERSMDRRGP